MSHTSRDFPPEDFGLACEVLDAHRYDPATVDAYMIALCPTHGRQPTVDGYCSKCLDYLT